MSLTLAAIMALVTKSAPSWLASLNSTVLDKSREIVVDKGKGFVETKGAVIAQRMFRLDEREQARQLEQALKNAVERGLASFTTLEGRDQYKDVLYILMQMGPQGETLRKEALTLFTLSDTPDLTKLSDIYNRRKGLATTLDEPFQNIDVGPYLASFFNALLGQLYANPYFKQQLSQALQLRAMNSINQSLLDITTLLQQIEATLEEHYTAQQFEQDVALYIEHMERTLRTLKIINLGRRDDQKDPTIAGIFVPLRITVQEQDLSDVSVPSSRIVLQERAVLDDRHEIDAIIPALEQHPYLVVLGGPGSGKSTAMRYVAWCHTSIQQTKLQNNSYPLLSGAPLPLRIELRRLSEERRLHNYDFLSFAVEVLLKREGVEVDGRMFKELLARGMMLLLFDGLDEVATIDERARIVEEIEHFTLRYPNNRVIVTSRPVGYDLVRFSRSLFTHARILPFNDEQIQQFLQNWYAYVLDLSPIPQIEQQELDLLLQTIQKNARLHKLAENPLLLTVITELHRSARLPDKRVLVYDRCAELLLETWARFKGTHARWQAMKMVTEDQRACVAHLGFFMHKLSQERRQKGDADAEIMSDVTARTMLQEVEKFLKERNLIAELAQQRNEAKLFIDLIKEEAGLIVERGTDPNGEPLYGFVHRTFQEYFAAVHVFEHFQQEVDLDIVRKFLKEHLHDPHWREVIFLLLGKLSPRPVTKLLRQILQGDLLSLRSIHTDILKQDLFFICDCLVEEIAVENDLIQDVISALVYTIQNTPFGQQCMDILDYLGALMQTKQCGDASKQSLIELITTDTLDDSLIKLEAAKVFYLRSIQGSEERRMTMQMLSSILERPDLPVEPVHQMVLIPGFFLPGDSEKRFLTRQILSSLLQRPDLSIDQARQIASNLYYFSEEGSEERHLAKQMLLSLLVCSKLTIGQVFQVATDLYRSSAGGSEERQQAIQILMSLLKHPDLAVDQALDIVIDLYDSTPPHLEERFQAKQMLTSLLQYPKLTIDQSFRIVADLYCFSEEGSEEQSQARQTLLSLLAYPDLSIGQACQIIIDLYISSLGGSVEERRQEKHLLMTLLQRSDLTIDQTCEVVLTLYGDSAEGSEERRLARQKLVALLECPELTIGQVFQVITALYQFIVEGSEERQQVAQKLVSLLQHTDLPIDLVLKVAAELCYSRVVTKRCLASQMLLSLLKRPDLSIDQICDIAINLHHFNPDDSEEQYLATRVLLAHIQLLSSHEKANDVYRILKKMVPQFHKCGTDITASSEFDQMSAS